MLTTMPSYEIETTAAFDDWHAGLRDRAAAGIVSRRIVRLSAGLLGDVVSVGGGVSEARIDFGPGYRLYFTIRGGRLIVLLLGGDKSSQRRDIARAIEMAADLKA
jgi:putative addiction module killer protein